MYNNNIVPGFLDLYSEELMKALMPFMKSDYFSTSSSSSSCESHSSPLIPSNFLPSSNQIRLNQLTPNQILHIQAQIHIQ